MVFDHPPHIGVRRVRWRGVSALNVLENTSYKTLLVVDTMTIFVVISEEEARQLWMGPLYGDRNVL